MTGGLTAVLLLGMLVSHAAGQTPPVATAAMIYIEPTDDGFETYITAAIIKKKLPASVTQNRDLATLTLKAAVVEEHKETTGSKVMKCLFASCAGTADKANTSAQLLNSEGTVLWSYAVNKARGNKNRQSMAEAIAEHLKKEYFRR